VVSVLILSTNTPESNSIEVTDRTLGIAGVIPPIVEPNGKSTILPEEVITAVPMCNPVELT